MILLTHETSILLGTAPADFRNYVLTIFMRFSLLILLPNTIFVVVFAVCLWFLSA